MSLKKVFALLVVGLMLAAALAACGDPTATTVPATTAPAATTAKATTAAAATTAAPAATTAAATTAAATTAAATTAAPAATTAAATTAAATTAAATAAGAAAYIEDVKFDGTSGKKGGQLVYTFAGQVPDGLQPYYSSATVAQEVMSTIYVSLINTSNNAKFFPQLVTQVPTVENGGVKVAADGKTMDITLKLKPGLKWSDGSPLTSKDLAFTHKWVLDPDNTGLSNGTDGWDSITEVQTPDDTTAILKFKSIYGAYLNFLGGFIPLPEKVWSKIPLKDGGAEKSPEATKPTVVSGPFKVDDYVQDDRVVLSRNDNFASVFGFSAYLDKIIFRSTPDANACIAAVTKKEIDYCENLDDNLGDQASKVPDAKLYIDNQFTGEFLQYNLSNPVLADKAVREALLVGLDREALVKQFRTPKTQVLPNTFVYPISPFFDSSIKVRPFDATKAKQILEDAGWKAGSDGIRAKNGTKLSFTLSSTTAPVRVATAEVMLTYWKAIGADVKFQAYKSAEFFGSFNSGGILATGKFDVGMFAQTTNIDPDIGYANWHSSQIPTTENKGNGNNYGRIKDATIDKALDDARATVDFAKRTELYKQAQQAEYNNVYTGPLYTRVNNYVLLNRIKNFRSNPTTATNLWNSFELYVG